MYNAHILYMYYRCGTTGHLYLSTVTGDSFRIGLHTKRELIVTLNAIFKEVSALRPYLNGYSDTSIEPVFFPSKYNGIFIVHNMTGLGFMVCNGWLIVLGLDVFSGVAYQLFFRLLMLLPGVFVLILNILLVSVMHNLSYPRHGMLYAIPDFFF